MHVIVNRNAMLEVLGVAVTIAGGRTTKDILKCVRLTTIQDGLLINVTDLEVSLRGRVDQIDVKKTGDALLPADKLMQIVRESTDDTLVIEQIDDTCHIRGRDSHFEIYGQDPKEFPPLPELQGNADVEIMSETLLSLIERTVFAVAKENTRYAINGVLWEKVGKKLSLVSTDGRRLARTTGPVEVSVGDDAQMIVPAKTVQVLQRVLTSVEGKASIRFSENQITVEAGNYIVASSLVEGHFPNYEEVIPKDSDKKIELNTEDLMSAVRRAALLTNEQSKGVRLAFDAGKLVLSSRAPEQGEATVAIEIKYDGDPIEIGFNPAFLVEALRVVGTNSVTMEMKESNRPGVLKAEPGFVYVLMPVSLS